MKHAVLISLLTLICSAAMAQDRIYRCGNEYTNTVPANRAKDCKLIEGGNVTVVPGTRPATQPPAGADASKVVTAPAGSPKVDNSEQKARDADARAILESELRKAEARLAELQKEYNNGEPEKQGGEAKNYQKYLDRVAALKESVTRAEADVAGIKREIARLK
ncbi:MAG: hypothetical protein EKK45_22245 [Curvibacter sp.]|nr:MAG: hypothetical protein EKK45_22245 [Curvibacter sp.]